MVKIKYFVIAALAVGIAVWAAFYLFQSEERKVKKQFHQLEEWVSKEGSENAFIMAHTTQKIGSLFAEKFALKTEMDSVSGTYTPEERSSLAARGRLLFSYLTLTFSNFDISFPEKGTAKVALVARLKGRSTAGESMDETHELESILKKIDQRWLFSYVEMFQVLKK